jgi:mono/diheme cytochrome c family protein
VALACGCTRSGVERDSHAALVRRGREVFSARCAPCHGPQADWPIAGRLKGRSADELYALFDHLPSVNPIMPRFDDAPEEDRRAVAAFLAGLTPGGDVGAGEAR